MTYLITQIWLCLLIAAVLGFVIGWLLRGLCKCQQNDNHNLESDNSQQLQADLDACNKKLLAAERSIVDLEASASAKVETSVQPVAALSPSGMDMSNKPTLLLDAAPAQVDDLKRIKGVGNVLEKLLHELGIYQFAQVADFDRTTIDWIDERLKFKGRIDRDEWVAQAKVLRDE